MDRPTGVYLISFLQVFTAAYLLSVAIFDYAYGSFGGNNTLALLALIMSIFMFAVGFATWVMKPWAWTATLIVQILHIAREFLAYFWADQYLGFFTLIISAVILYYLTRPEIRKGFGH